MGERNGTFHGVRGGSRGGNVLGRGKPQTRYFVSDIFGAGGMVPHVDCAVVAGREAE